LIGIGLMKLIFKGIVQGVGFRPTIYRIAKDMGLRGYVLNNGSEVEVVIDRKKDDFISTLLQNLPKIAKITEISEEKDNRIFSDFQILHSKNGQRHSPIPIDIAICEDCITELYDKKNRRYHFPFTNCTICGARYSVITDLPYDRERTSMKKFELCKSCLKEYKNPINRRYYAQTISCHVCGPKYNLYNSKKRDLGSDNSILKFAEQIEKGKIGVIKSWGGMHICCKIDEIPRFRIWYNRPQKSFALMAKDIEAVKKYAIINDSEKKLLLSKNKPIVLLEKKQLEIASPGLNSIGIYLPYTGLHYLLFSFLSSDVLVMTSANLPGEPMIIRNDDVFVLNADYYLLHNRDIPNRVDDSVIRVWKGNKFFLRKSRGFVPDPIEVDYPNNVLSVGPGENITGAFSSDRKVYSTQYIGNSKYYSVIEFLEKSLRHIIKLTSKKQEIDAIAQDLHPGYDSRIVARRFSEKFSAPIFDVQHDWAHAVSLLIDNSINESIIIVIEGLGYGTDNTFWGGDVLHASFNDFKRIGHLGYIPLLGGDKATLDPRRIVYAIFKKIGKEKIFSGNEASILSKLMKKSPYSCSLGRYLDALSCYLEICCTRTYNGEPAMKLEKYLAKGKPTIEFDVTVKNNVIDVVDCFRQMDEKIIHPLSDNEKANISYSFLNSIVGNLANIAINHAMQNGLETVGLSGGVSYNIPITEMIERIVKKAGLRFIVHNNIPNGDGGIAVGQNVIVGHKL
jgi:hydrogenase maturation protein HypF